ncbi:MAG: thiamine biosynthesis protein ApbE [Devosia sp.]|uniref:FAD:protein FMN transferase n=1 Tax=Devosia sp. TaxID=1871048 RepID=UPI0026022541|nr:FAD:protein FMN transferase [Devosia sp.]MDB5529954.1 thiamine biosynthesis protein ApbE [Devosia sp.]
MSIEQYSVVPSVAWQPFPMSAPLQRYALNEATMGTRYSAIFFAAAGLDTTPIADALQAAVDEVDNQMSTWKPASDLSRVNAAPVGQWVEIPHDLANVLAASLEIGRASGGAFHIGVGDLVNAWGFGPTGAQPHTARIAELAAQPRSAMDDMLDLDAAGGRVRKRAPVTLDLSGIAKGFGVDQLARCLDGFGIAHYLVGIDGEMRASGHKPGGGPWVLAVEQPDQAARDVARLIKVTDCAIATSGDYRHRVEMDGHTASHTMDPASGRPLSNNLASVTVLAADCMHADAWATALMVLGDIEGPAFAARRGMDALFIVRDGNGFRELAVGAFRQG